MPDAISNAMSSALPDAMSDAAPDTMSDAVPDWVPAGMRWSLAAPWPALSSRRELLYACRMRPVFTAHYLARLFVRPRLLVSQRLAPFARVLGLPVLLLLALALGLAPQDAAAQRGWQPAERIETYNVTGASGIELYRAIGENGPSVGIGRVIAHTRFDLTWSRDYRPQPDGSCVLAVARPNLTIIYTLPRATGLPARLEAAWARFIAGVEAHERVHGDHVVEMVEAIEAFSTGLSAPADPGCQKVRAILQQRLGELSNAQRARARDFDRLEMSEGGNVHQLVLALANTP
jgi:predicted secreted Zn-dependent protease